MSLQEQGSLEMQLPTSTYLLLLRKQEDGPGMKVGGGWQGALGFRTGEAELAQPSMSGGT